MKIEFTNCVSQDYLHRLDRKGLVPNLNWAYFDGEYLEHFMLDDTFYFNEHDRDRAERWFNRYGSDSGTNVTVNIPGATNSFGYSSPQTSGSIATAVSNALDNNVVSKTIGHDGMVYELIRRTPYESERSEIIESERASKERAIRRKERRASRAFEREIRGVLGGEESLLELKA